MVVGCVLSSLERHEPYRCIPQSGHADDRVLFASVNSRSAAGKTFGSGLFHLWLQTTILTRALGVAIVAVFPSLWKEISWLRAVAGEVVTGRHCTAKAGARHAPPSGLMTEGA